MEVRDLEAQQRLSTLIDRVCDRKNPALDATLLSSIKHLCRQSDGNVAQAWEALWVHLRAPHAQVGGGGDPATSWKCPRCCPSRPTLAP